MAFNAQAKENVKELSTKLLTETCTQTVTTTRSADVECPDGTIITISATVTETASGETCEMAAAAAGIISDYKAYVTVKNNIQAKNYICP